MKKNKFITAVLLLCCFVNLTSAQVGHEDVFPDLTNQELRDAVNGAFKPAVVLDYGRARDTMFRRVYGKNDSLSCIYSGHRVYMNPAEDPTTTVFMNGSADGINTEHTWPQAYGAASGNARSNMYHLFPARVAVNEARGSFPFAEIPDAQTQSWFYLNQTQSNIPSSNIDAYAEKINGAFEPREQVKGDIARAMFYFYVIYDQEVAANAPANFFSSQLPTLYQWHLQDPVDAEEWERNSRIAVYQSNKSNPFILDETLATRAFCADLGIACTTSTEPSPDDFVALTLSNSPNPFSHTTQINYELPQAGTVRLTVYNVVGQQLALLLNTSQLAGTHNLQWTPNKNDFPQGGLLLLKLDWYNQDQRQSSITRLVLVP